MKGANLSKRFCPDLRIARFQGTVKMGGMLMSSAVKNQLGLKMILASLQNPLCIEAFLLSQMQQVGDQIADRALQIVAGHRSGMIAVKTSCDEYTEGLFCPASTVPVAWLVHGCLPAAS